MMKRILVMPALTAALMISSASALAADQDRTRDQDKTRLEKQDQDRIYGSQLMTQQERSEYRSRMRAAKTVEEREQIRNEHHEKMKVRAKERGVTLPDQPPAMGGGMRGGGGMGPGGGGMMGPGGGMGPGGRGR